MFSLFVQNQISPLRTASSLLKLPLSTLLLCYQQNGFLYHQDEERQVNVENSDHHREE